MKYKRFYYNLFSGDYRGDMIHCYHKPCDNLEVMLTDENLHFLSKIADTLTSTINKLSKGMKTISSFTMSSFIYYFKTLFGISALFMLKLDIHIKCIHLYKHRFLS